jgi:hypothetical protein
LQADAEDSCNNETESPNVPEDPKKKNPKDEFETAKKSNPQILSDRKQTPIYPHTPVKVYKNAKESKSDIVRDFNPARRLLPRFHKLLFDFVTIYSK